MSQYRTQAALVGTDGMGFTGAGLVSNVIFAHRGAFASAALYSVSKTTQAALSCRSMVIFGGNITGTVPITLEPPLQFSTGCYVSLSAGYVTLTYQKKR